MSSLEHLICHRREMKKVRHPVYKREFTPHSLADTHTLLLSLNFGDICSSFVVQQEPMHPASTAEYMILQATKCDKRVAQLLHEMEEFCGACTLYTSLVPILLENGLAPESLSEYRRLRSLQLNMLTHGKTYIPAC